MKVTEEIIQKLKTKWDDYGYCTSCGWHSLFNEVKEDLVEQLEDDDICTVTKDEANVLIKNRDDILELLYLINKKYPLEFSECFNELE